ncbi:MAG: TonB-dependent receptor domain-containing protein [Parvularculaceae bacterium]
MTKHSRLAARLLSSTVLVGALSAAATSAMAQDEDTIIVTGSRLTNANVDSPSPVTTVDAELFDIRGAVDAIDLINTLPQVTPNQTSSFANGANGTSTVDLRGLGPTRTLVLANGKRLPPGSPTAGGFASDINLIAPQLIERVEVVTGGASAVYGSDAVAGVVNFILRRDFEGIEIDGLFGFNQSNNNSQNFQDALTAIGEDTVAGSVTDNPTYDISGIIGSNLDGGRGNVTAYFRYLRNDGIQQGDRDFARCATFSVGDDIFCAGANQGPFPKTFVLTPQFDYNGDAVPLFDAAGNPADGAVTGANAFSLNGDDTLSVGFNNAFNFNPFNPIRRSVERFNAGFSSYYNITDDVEAYMDFGFTQSNSPQIIAPSAAFGSAINQVNCDNPLLTPDQRALICGNASIDGPFPRDVDGDGFAQTEIRRRFVEGGPRTDDRTLTNFRIVGGFKGKLANDFEWDVFGQFANTTLSRLQTNQVTATNLAQSLDIVTDPETGLPVCRSALDGTAPGCVPFTSAFQLGVPSDPALPSFVDTPTLTQGSTQQTVFGGTIQGDLGRYGIQSPFADSGVSLLIGAEYRRDQLITQADATNQQILLVGAGGAVLPTNGATELYEFFFETAIPLISDAPLIEELGITGAYRFSDYDSFDFQNDAAGGQFTNSTFAAGVSWTPVSDVKIRGQFQRAIRAPNVQELFLPQNTNLVTLDDPCAGFFVGDEAPDGRTAAECANTGLDPAIFGAVPPDSGQLNVLIGGNTELTPEVADTITDGAILQPRWIEGLIFSIDYFNIDVQNIVGAIPAAFTLDACLDTGDPTFCSLIQRGPDGTLTTDEGAGSFIVTTSQNIASQATAGVDFQIAYSYDFGQWGSVNWNYNSTWLRRLETRTIPGTGSFNCAGRFSSGCSGNQTSAFFDYRHNLSTTWTTPWDVRLSALWRYLGSTDQITSINSETGAVATLQDGIAATLDAQNYLDVAMFWDATENVELRFGVNNILDNDPPIVPTFNGIAGNIEANTFAGTFDAAGRFIFAGVNIRF